MNLYPLILIVLIALGQQSGLNRVSTAQKPTSKAQAPGLATESISGTVTDASGAVLPGVQVSLRLQDGAEKIVTTDDAGYYRINNIPPGTYALRFSRTGFSVRVVPNVSVNIGRSSSLDLQLTTGPSPSPIPTPSPIPSPIPSPSVNPSPTPSPSPGGTDWEAKIRAEESKLRESKIAFNPPSEMLEQQPETMQARISFEDIGPALGTGLKGTGTTQIETLKVSPIMKVSLAYDPKAFSVVPIGSEEQVIAGKTYAEWGWQVTPLQTGEQTLTLTATATIFLEGRGEKPVYYKTMEKPIRVRVDRWRTTKQFVGNNWPWLWTVLVVPAVGLLWKLRRKKNRTAGFR